MSNTENKPKVVTEKFRVRHGGVTVTMGISNTTGTLCVYSYEDETGYHSSGRFPVAKYASQWKFNAKVGPAVQAFIEHDEASPNPKLAQKSRVSTATMGETLDFEAPDPIVSALAAAKGISITEAQRIAEESGLLS